jgi:hypothetical protein
MSFKCSQELQIRGRKGIVTVLALSPELLSFANALGDDSDQGKDRVRRLRTGPEVTDQTPERSAAPVPVAIQKAQRQLKAVSGAPGSLIHSWMDPSYTFTFW